MSLKSRLEALHQTHFFVHKNLSRIPGSNCTIQLNRPLSIAWAKNRVREMLVQDAIMQFFVYDHLPESLRDISKPFCELAKLVSSKVPRNAERTVALRKLLEAKDAAVRAYIAKEVT